MSKRTRSVRADGVREVLGLALGLSEDTVFWWTFFRSLIGRGRHGVQLVISDAHPGLKQAIAEVFVGAAWQRCRVHFMQNLLARVPKTAQAMLAAAVRTIFRQADWTAVQRQLRDVCRSLQAKFPQAVALLEEAEEEIFTFYDFPAEHWRQIYSTNPLERLNKELKRRSAVVGIFPDRAAVLRLLGALLMEQNGEWLVGRHYFRETSMHKPHVTARRPSRATQYARGASRRPALLRVSQATFTGAAVRWTMAASVRQRA